jgi:glycosyltransferase involved in cell wall biosynthesis
VRAELGLDEEQKLIVSVARLAPQKSLDVMLRAMTLLAPETVLALLGEGPLRRELETLSRSAGLNDRVRFIGFRADASDWLAAADVFCLSSIWEGIPLSAQEAILLGTPVVATDVGGMRELISNKVSGRLVPPTDPHALAAALGDVLADPERAGEYARSALRTVKEVFSTARMLDRLRSAYVG